MGLSRADRKRLNRSGIVVLEAVRAFKGDSNALANADLLEIQSKVDEYNTELRKKQEEEQAEAEKEATAKEKKAKRRRRRRKKKEEQSENGND